MSRSRYVRLYHDEEGRFIGDHDYSSRADAETFPTMDLEKVDEVVRLLSRAEEDVIYKALEQAKKQNENLSAELADVQRLLGEANARIVDLENEYNA